MMLRNEVFDANFKRLGILEKFTYSQYIENWKESGTFTIKCPGIEENIALLKNDNIIWFEDDVAGVIQNVVANSSEQSEITANGCLLDGILDWRYIYPVFNYTGKVNELMNEAVNVNCISDEDAKRNFEYLEIESTETSLPSVSKQKTGGTVLEFVSELANAYLCGFRIGFYPKEKKMKFKVIEGVDRSVHSALIGNKVIFSESLNNIKSATYTNDRSSYRNVTLIAGEATVGSRSYVVVTDDGREEKSGFARRELYTDARDLQSTTVDEDGNEITLGEEAYQSNLTTRGKEKLSECIVKEYLESDVRSDVTSAYQYKRDYDIGDIVTVINESLNLTADVRVTSVTVTQDTNGYSVTPTLGDAQPTLYSVLKKKGVVI